MEKMLIRGVTKDKDVALVSVLGVKDNPGVAFNIFSKLSQKKYQCRYYSSVIRQR